VTLASELCGTCHGELTCHACYQWQISATATTSCDRARAQRRLPRCHGQRLLNWLPALLDNVAANDTASHRQLEGG
jgi:hypothetical protein